MTMNVDLGKHYEKIIEKAIYKGRAITKVDALRQALTIYDKQPDEEVLSKKELKELDKLEQEINEGKYVTAEAMDKLLKEKLKEKRT